jgi:hypothetical protein
MSGNPAPKSALDPAGNDRDSQASLDASNITTAGDFLQVVVNNPKHPAGPTPRTRRFAVAACLALAFTLPSGFFAWDAYGRGNRNDTGATDVIGYYRELITKETFGKESFYVQADAGSFLVYIDAGGLLRGAELSANSILLRTAVDGPANEIRVCSYIAEWEFEELPESRTRNFVRMKGRYVRRINFDEPTARVQLSPEQEKELARFKDRISREFKFSECVLELDSSSVLKRTCWYNGRKNDPVTSTFTLIHGLRQGAR